MSLERSQFETDFTHSKNRVQIRASESHESYTFQASKGPLRIGTSYERTAPSGAHPPALLVHTTTSLIHAHAPMVLISHNFDNERDLPHSQSRIGVPLRPGTALNRTKAAASPIWD